MRAESKASQEVSLIKTRATICVQCDTMLKQKTEAQPTAYEKDRQQQYQQQELRM